MSPLELIARREGEAVVLRLEGELDILTAPRVEREMAQAEERSFETVVLDLRGLEFMDSTGVRVLLAADARARRRGHRLVVVRGPDPVRRVLRVTGLDDRLEIVDDPAHVG